MTDIMLVFPSYVWDYASPPLGLAYIAAVLRNSGFDVRILDMTPTHTTMDQLEKELRADRPKIVGISAMTCQANMTLQIAEMVKKVDVLSKVVVGGPHPTALPEEMLENTAIDVVCIGEGEYTMNELAASLLKGDGDFESISGLAYRDKNGKTVRTDSRPLISDLDGIPFLAWDLLPLEKYRVAHMGLRKAPTYSLLSSRGCPYRCIFCSSSLTMGTRFRMRSAKNIFDEIEMLYSRFGLRQFDFVDDTITVNRERMDKFCDLMIESKLGILWACNSTVRVTDPTIFRKMRDAGCRRIDFGVESGDAEVLKMIGKGTTIPQIVETHRRAKEAGLKTGSFFMVGLPGQDKESITKSITLLHQINTDFPGFSIATPFPGTKMYEMSKENNWLRTSDWSKYLTIDTEKGHEPVMETDKMTKMGIIKAYRLLLVTGAQLILRKQYGARYYLNPRLYIDSLRSSGSPVNRSLLRRNLKNIPKLLKLELWGS